jgi:hypothetical protein
MESLLPDTPERQKSAANERAFIDEIQAILATGESALDGGKKCQPRGSSSLSTT